MAKQAHRGHDQRGGIASEVLRCACLPGSLKSEEVTPATALSWALAGIKTMRSIESLIIKRAIAVVPRSLWVDGIMLCNAGVSFLPPLLGLSFGTRPLSKKAPGTATAGPTSRTVSSIGPRPAAVSLPAANTVPTHTPTPSGGFEQLRSVTVASICLP